jgi:hypothetical protein
MIAILVCVLPLRSQNTDANNGVVNVSFCDLIDKANQYVGEKVRISATYISAFEASEVFCLACRERMVWLEFDESVPRKSLRKLTNQKLPYGVGYAANLDVVGILNAGSYGHFGIYPYLFQVTSVKKVRILPEGVDSRSTINEEQKRLVCAK